ncbi:hypothetical protein GQ43DRAFT_405229 [Delitschia confertaspora ATCC 74209]|uniref:Azaphilone pigments biosynthesis cluster protein L N-terminal domain-containing protein n=1 Tax=Delitschia confertaspora ATCC 74209 TaxID=1513339 RepID=A0A9P4JBD9_9PLEO|nr:hypothetical protein GQ43DRAFT_405229 [Delitschia confertaspora ATCC 74209]
MCFLVAMDPLSITVAVLGITTAALQSVQFLAKMIGSIKGAPDAVKDISADLEAVQPVLQNLEKALQDSSLQIIFSSQVKRAIENCQRACQAFQSQVEHWMRHSTQEKTFWMDRWKIGLFGQDRIKAFKGQLSDCKGTLSVALSTMTIITTSRQENLMNEMKEMMLQHNEAVLQQQLTRAGNEKTEIERSLQQLMIGMSSELSDGLKQSKESEQSRQELLQELRSQQTTNAAYREMCEEALSTTVYKRAGQKIKGVKATNNSAALTGFINTSGGELKINQDISNILADNQSIAVVGVIKNMDFKDLRSGGSR